MYGFLPKWAKSEKTLKSLQSVEIKEPQRFPSEAVRIGGDGGNIPLSRTPSAPLSRASLLDRGFPGVLLSIHPDPNPPYALDVGSIPSFHQTTKEGPMDPLLLSGESREIRTLFQGAL